MVSNEHVATSLHPSGAAASSMPRFSFRLEIVVMVARRSLINTRKRLGNGERSPLTIYCPLILSSVSGSFSPFDVSVFLGYSRRTFIIAGKSPILSRNPDLLDTNHLTFPATYFCWALGFIGTQVRHSPANHICRHHEFIFSSMQSSSGPLLGPPASTIDVRRTMQLAALNPRGPRSGSPATVLTTLDSCDLEGLLYPSALKFHRSKQSEGNSDA